MPYKTWNLYRSLTPAYLELPTNAINPKKKVLCHQCSNHGCNKGGQVLSPPYLNSEFTTISKKNYSPVPLFPIKKREPFRCHWVRKTGHGEKLLCWFACFIFDQDRGDCFCCYWSPHKNSEFSAVVDVCHLETDNQSKAKAGDTY